MAGESTSTRPSRAPKTVERFVPAPASTKEKAEVVIEKGSGTKLGDIEAIADNLKGVSSDDDLLKALHSVLFGGTGKKTTRKRDIRAFNGFAKNSGTTLAARTQKMIEKKSVWTTATLKDLADLFGLEKSGDRDALCKRVIDFLGSPSADDVKASGGVKRKRESSGGEKKVKKASKSKKDKGDKPKRAPSGFILFSNANRAEILKKSPGLPVPEVGKKLGEMWRNASDATKKKFNDMSEKRKKELASEKPAAAAKKPAAKKEKEAKAAKKDETEDEEEDVVEDEEEEEQAEEESPKKKSKK